MQNCSLGRFAAQRKQGRSARDAVSIFAAEEMIRAGLNCNLAGCSG